MNTPATHRQPLSSATNSNYKRCPPEIMHRCRKVTFHALLRIALGLNICMHGIIRWTSGLRSFAESLLPMFQKTPLPTWSVYSFGYLLPIVEAAIGACLLFAFQTRRALVSGSVLMLFLTFGPTLRQDWPTVGIQLTYSVVYSVLLAGIRFNSYGVDRLLPHRSLPNPE